MEKPYIELPEHQVFHVVVNNGKLYVDAIQSSKDCPIRVYQSLNDNVIFQGIYNHNKYQMEILKVSPEFTNHFDLIGEYSMKSSLFFDFQSICRKVIRTGKPELAVIAFNIMFYETKNFFDW